jgi:hypothetical protein
MKYGSASARDIQLGPVSARSVTGDSATAPTGIALLEDACAAVSDSSTLLTALSLTSRAREGRADPARSVGKIDPLEPPGRRCGCWPMSPISF